MNHTITIGGLLLSLSALTGLLMAAVGGLMVFAGGTSDAPSEGERVGGQGCAFALLGCAILIGAVVGLFA
jgi:hypothetical protein